MTQNLGSRGTALHLLRVPRGTDPFRQLTLASSAHLRIAEKVSNYLTSYGVHTGNNRMPTNSDATNKPLSMITQIEAQTVISYPASTGS